VNFEELQGGLRRTARRPLPDGDVVTTFESREANAGYCTWGYKDKSGRM
jgi:hypothetical protein